MFGVVAKGFREHASSSLAAPSSPLVPTPMLFPQMSSLLTALHRSLHDPRRCGACMVTLVGALACAEDTPDPSASQGGMSAGVVGGASATPGGGGASGGEPTSGAGTTTGPSHGAAGGETTNGSSGGSHSGGSGATAGSSSEATSTDDTSSDDPSDAGATGTAHSDGGIDPHSWEGCDDFELPAGCTIPEGAVLPGELRCTGLYSNWEERTHRCGVEAYKPAYELWSDGAEKQRYVWLPPGQTVDVSNPDDFDYPVGTRFWKEFYVGPEGEQKLGETRYMLKSSLGWLYTVYVWNEGGTAALQENEGVEDLFATGHSVPSREQCKSCHIGRKDFILGWDFIMLGEGATGVTAATLADADLLEGLDPAWLDLAPPGDSVEQAALAYLHANCGVSCHNTTLDATGNPSGLYLRLELDSMSNPLETAAASAINQHPAPNAKMGGLPELVYYDFRPGDPERSLVYARMNVRGSETAMPALGTHQVDPEGLSVVKAWIDAMTEERGYPPPAP